MANIILTRIGYNEYGTTVNDKLKKQISKKVKPSNSSS
jgi:hypothetical protein